MRIAIFSEVYWPMVSGVARTLRRTVEALRARGHEVRVYSATYRTDGADGEPAEVYQSPSQPFWLSPEVQWANPDLAAVTGDLRNFAPDVVHLATEFAMGLAGLRAARALRAPLIASAHTDYERYAARYGLGWAVGPGWAWLRWFYGQAQAVLAPSHSYAARLVERGIGHVGVWTRGVDSERFAPGHRSAMYRARLGLGPRDLLVAYVGRLAPEKGIDRLLTAWPTIAQLHPRAHLVFTGGGQLESLIRREQRPRTHLTGPLGGSDLSTAYASADVFVMPSETETFGNVTLEAMASGVATVAVASGGTLDFARHGENAWLADPAHPADFVTGLDRLLADERLRARLGGGGRATALTRGWEPVVDDLVQHYHAVVISSDRARRAA